MKTAKFILGVLVAGLLWFGLGWAEPKAPVFATTTRTLSFATSSNVTTDVSVAQYGALSGETGTLQSVRVEVDYDTTWATGIQVGHENLTNCGGSSTVVYNGDLATSAFQTVGTFPTHPYSLLTDLQTHAGVGGNISCTYDGARDYAGSSGFTALNLPPNANPVGNDTSHSTPLGYFAGSGNVTLRVLRSFSGNGPDSGTCSCPPFTPANPWASFETYQSGGTIRVVYTHT